MTHREEEIQSIAKIIADKEEALPHHQWKEYCVLKAAQWADAHPDKQSIVKYLRELGYTVTLNGDVITRDQEIKDMEQYVKYQKEKLIEKACEWLKENADKYIWYDTNDFDCGMIDEFVANFKKVMEE